MTEAESSGPGRPSDRVVILGGGPAGLTAAYELGRANVASVILEREAEVGGLAKTVEYRGFRFDLGGHRFFTDSDWVQALWEDVLGDAFLFRPRLSRILYRNRFFQYPLRPLDAFLGLGVLASIQVLLSYARAKLWPAAPERTFEDWTSNRFGRQLYRTFFKSYTEKVLGIACTELSADWAARRLDGLSLSTALGNAFARSTPDATARSLIDAFHYPRLGSGMLWQALAHRIAGAGGEIRCNRSVERVQWSDDHITAVEARSDHSRTERVHGTHVLSSIALRDLVRCLEPPPPHEVREAAEKLLYRDFMLVALIVDKAEVFADNWIYVHDGTVRVGRIQNFKNWSADMVPDRSKSCLGLEYFCTRGDDLWQADDTDLIAFAATELERLGLCRRREVVDGKVERVPQAYPLYDVDYRAHVDTVSRFFAGFANLRLIGRNGMHRYVNQDHAMISARRAVAGVLKADKDIRGRCPARHHGA